jgi:hypothetical protein
MLRHLKIFLVLAILVGILFACKSTPKPTLTPTIDSAATAAAQAAAEGATAKAQAALNDKATAEAQATADAKATANQATANAKATADAQATANAKATAEAQAALNATATANAQATLDAQATADAAATQAAAATATQAAKEAAQQATQTAVAAKATQAAEAVLSVINDELSIVGMSTKTGSLGFIQSGSEMIAMDTAWQAFYQPFAEGLVASDFVLKTEVTWQAEGGLLICGFEFRSEADFSNGDQYKLVYLRLSGAPGWDIEYWTGGEFKTNITGKVRFASAIKMENGSTNKFVLIAEGNKFTLYINDQRIGQFFDYSNSRMDGRFAFYGTEEAGTSSCEFENTWVWLLK